MRAKSRVASRALAVQQRDGLGVLAQVDELGAEARLAIGLVVVEPNSGRPRKKVTHASRSPRSRPPTRNSSGLIDHSTPENAMIGEDAVQEHRRTTASWW